MIHISVCTRDAYAALSFPPRRHDMRYIFGLAFLALTLWCTGVSAENNGALSPLPPLNDPATGEHLPGKVIFADYFTSDIDTARRFYGQLFGWEWRAMTGDNSYGMFYQGDLAVAGVALREETGNSRAYGRWIYYISTAQVAEKVAEVSGRGGRVLLEAQEVAGRGTMAVVADAEEAPFGLLESSSGDPADYRSEPGQWLWVSLYSHDVEKASDFYRSLFGYDVSQAEDVGDNLDLILSKGGYARAGIGHLPAESPSHPTWLGYVRVADVGASVAKALELGGDVLMAPAPEIFDGKLAVVSDPAGATIALIHWNYDDTGVAP
jgi:predicted enzyme related to lactoylglutathione lyase